jgi:hypothetical protein
MNVLDVKFYMSDISEYKTKDVYIASTLIARGLKQYRIERNGRQCFFIFSPEIEDTPTGFSPVTFLEMEIEQYWSGNLLVDPKELFNAFKELKNRMYVEDKQ